MPEAAVIRLATAAAPVVTFEEVTLALGGRTPLDGLSFDLLPGGITALMGPNGAGKSLTLRVLAGLIEPDAGTVSFAGGRPCPRELALVQALMARPGHAVSKERLFELVFPGETDVQFEAVEVVVYRLRKKLAGSGAALVTLRGLGYLLKAEG